MPRKYAAHQKLQILTYVQSVRNVVRMRQRTRCELGVSVLSLASVRLTEKQRVLQLPQAQLVRNRAHGRLLFC